MHVGITDGNVTLQRSNCDVSDDHYSPILLMSGFYLHSGWHYTLYNSLCIMYDNMIVE